MTAEILARLDACDNEPERLSALIRRYLNESPTVAYPFFEVLVLEYPTCGHFWRLYLEYTLRQENIEKVQELFKRCLPKVLSIELYTFYLSFMHAYKHKSTSFRDIMGSAYDFVIDKVGLDMHSFSIWRQHVNFLRSVTADNSFADNQKIVSVRKIFQRAVLIPIIGVEQMWKDYCAFEIGINIVLAKRVIDERSREYLNVKRVAKELEAYTRVLDRDVIIRVGGRPVWRRNNTYEYYEKQVQAWKRYIAYEMSNPLKVDNHWYRVKRVVYAYEQCILCIGHRPDIWYEAVEYMCGVGRQLLREGDSVNSRQIYKEAGGLFDRAIETFMRDNRLIHFAFADFQELRLDYEGCHESYKSLIKHMKEKTVPNIRNNEFLTLAYIIYMRFSKRVEGIDSYRAVFKKARMEPRCGCEIYVAGALSEFYCTRRASVACRVLDAGLKKYSKSPKYIEAVANFWLSLSAQHFAEMKDQKTRSLKEMMIELLNIAPPQLRLRLLKKYSQMACCFSKSIAEIKAIQNTSSRNQSRNIGIQKLIDRFSFRDLYPCDHFTLRSVGYSEMSDTSAMATDREALFTLPNTSQMKVYVPMSSRPLGHVGVHIDEYGLFPYPPWACFLLKRLPAPYAYRGPFVLVDGLIEVFKNMKLPEQYECKFGEYFAEVQSVYRERFNRNHAKDQTTDISRADVGDDDVEMEEANVVEVERSCRNESYSQVNVEA